jgi:hypothetical protein
MAKLTRDKTQTLLHEAEDAFLHGACNTCECFLGYLAQLRIDSDPADKDLFAPFKIRREEMRKCLGCDPCPPADLYAAYMLNKQNLTKV